jgi:hypothetical protein
VFSRKKLIVLALIAVISISSGLYAYSNFTTSQDSKLNGSNNDLLIESFNPSTIVSNVTGGSFILVNPTSKNFENLTLSVKIDDSEAIVPILRLLKHPTVPISTIDIESNQNETIAIYLFDPDLTEPPFYKTIVNPFSSHTFKFFISQNTFGDIVNGQSFTIPQEKAYLQITNYSSIEHDNDTWHEHYNINTNRQEYINDQPNFYQQYHHLAFFPMESNSFNWAKSLNQIGEHYFNVTIFNNSTFLVQKIAFNLGEGGMRFALPDKILQPNEKYIVPVAAGGLNWWSVESVNQLSNFYPAQAYAVGDLTN